MEGIEPLIVGLLLAVVALILIKRFNKISEEIAIESERERVKEAED